MDEIERILSTEEMIEPSPAFSSRVMTEVTRQARLPPPIPFPWRRFVAAAACIAISGVAVAMTPDARDCLRDSLVRLSDTQEIRVGGSVLALAASLGIASWSVWAAARSE